MENLKIYLIFKLDNMNDTILCYIILFSPNDIFNEVYFKEYLK